MRLILTDWPVLPPHPSEDEVAILCLSCPAPRPAMRRAAREAILATARAWGYPDASLREQPTGPQLVGCGTWALSLSYAGDHAWIAFARRDTIGIDATEIRDFEGMREVAHTYLDPEENYATAEAFADGWSRREAALKYHRLPLTEWRTDTPVPPRHLTVRAAGCAVSVAFGG